MYYFLQKFAKRSKKLCVITNIVIVNILGSIDDKIENLENLNFKLENYSKLLFKEEYVDFTNNSTELKETEIGLIPKDWHVGKLMDIMDFTNGYAFNSENMKKEADDSCYNVFKMGCIKKGGGFDYSGTKSWIDKSLCINLNKYVLKTGDLLMAMTDMKGNIALLGNTALMNTDDKYIVNQRVGLLRANKNYGTDYEYLYLLTNEYNFLEYLRGRSNSGVQVNLTSEAIKEALLAIAPTNYNLKFESIVKPIFNKIFNNQKLIDHYKKLKQLYLKKFFG